MGTVFLALDTKLDRRVAIKVLPAASVNDAGAVTRFLKCLAKVPISFQSPHQAAP
jgi:hypothetical protein